MIEGIARCEERIIKIQGGPRSGKTEALVQRCAHLLRNGTSPAEILVETSTAFAAQAFKARLARELADSEITQMPCVESVSDSCVRALSSEQAVRHVGRVPYVLNRSEYVFLLEDLKTLGLKVRKLRSMLARFARQWAAGTPEEKWVAPGEEEAVYRALTGLLVQRNAMLPEELAFRCMSYLQSSEGTAGRHAFRYVLCDDFQNLSAAEQAVLGLLATDQLIIAGDAKASVGVRTDFASPEGFAQFEALRHNVHLFELDSSVRERPQVTVVKWNTPEEELDGATKWLRIAVDRGEIPENRVCVVVPNQRWAQSAATVLRKRGFKVNDTAVSTELRGDPREIERARSLVAYTKLALLADERNVVAWRSACGFGNYLTNSDAWSHLAEYANAHELGLYEALAQISDSGSDSPFLRSEALVKPFREYRSFVDANRNRRGFSLLSAIGADKLSEFKAVMESMAGDETASELFALTRQTVSNPAFVEGQHALRLAVPQNLCGLEFDIVLVLGAVNGFYPRRDAFEVVSTDDERNNLMMRDGAAFRNAVSKATRELAVSYFSKSDLELAERAKMLVSRVRSENERRIALVHPSCFLEEEPFTAAGITGGAQLLANCGID